MEKRQAFLLFLAVFVLRKMVGSQTDAERVTWGMLYLGPLVTQSVSNGLIDLYRDYDALQKKYDKQNMTIAKALGFRVAKDAIDYLVQRQGEDAAFVHLQRRL